MEARSIKTRILYSDYHSVKFGGLLAYWIRMLGAAAVVLVAIVIDCDLKWSCVQAVILYPEREPAIEFSVRSYDMLDNSERFCDVG